MMISPTMLAMSVAGFLTIALVLGIGGFSLFLGAFDAFFGRPTLTILKSVKGATGFAFAFNWDSGKEPVKINRVRVRLFNPFGEPKLIDTSADFPAFEKSFAIDIDLGSGYENFLRAKGFEQSRVEVEIYSAKSGVSYKFEYKGTDFKLKLLNAPETVLGYAEKFKEKVNPQLAEYGVVPQKSMIADTVPGKGPQLKIVTNPNFASDFSAATGGAAAPAGAPVEDFKVSKVWIEAGCIVCNACENIYPEVFEVKTDGCFIRANAPLDHGLKIKEAADACPVEIIKFNKAG